MQQAQLLADNLGAQVPGTTTFQQEGEASVVFIQTSKGVFTIRREGDWTWLRPKITGRDQRDGASLSTTPPPTDHKRGMWPPSAAESALAVGACAADRRRAASG